MREYVGDSIFVNICTSLHKFVTAQISYYIHMIVPVAQLNKEFDFAGLGKTPNFP